MPRWLEPLLAWLRRSFGEVHSAGPAPAPPPVAWLQLGESAQPLLQRFVEPAIRVEVRNAVPLVHLSDSRAITVALLHNRVVAVRYRYPYHAGRMATDDAAGDAGRFLPPKARAAHDYRLLDRPDGWLLATADCPEAWLAVVDRQA
jgi:hypothetical protein